MRRVFVYLLPLVILTDCIGPLVPIGPIHAGHLKYGILLATVVATLPRWRLTLPVAAVLGFLIYVLGLALLASDWGNSLNGAMRLWLAFSMYPVAVSVLRTQRDVAAFLKTLALGSLTVVVTFGIAQVYPWGWEGYVRGGGGFSYGGMGAYATYALVYLTLAGAVALPLVRSPQRRRLMFALHVVATVIVLISFRRSAMAGLLVGLGVVALLGGVRISARRVLSLAGLLVPITAVAFFLFGDVVTQLYTARVTQGIEFEMASRFGRVAETQKVWGDFVNGSPRHMLFGTEFFNSTDIFEWAFDDRPIHIDYNVLLNGAGAIGLGGFFLVYFLIALRFAVRYRRLARSRYGVSIRALFFALFVASLILSASNQLWVTVPFALFFALLGTLQRSAELLPTKRSAAARAAPPVLRAPAPPSSPVSPRLHARTP